MEGNLSKALWLGVSILLLCSCNCRAEYFRRNERSEFWPMIVLGPYPKAWQRKNSEYMTERK